MFIATNNTTYTGGQYSSTTSMVLDLHSHDGKTVTLLVRDESKTSPQPVTKSKQLII